MELYNLIGVIGASAYLISYFLLQSGKIQIGYTYIILNLIGASFILYSLLNEYNLPSIIIQISWILISIYGLYRVHKIEKSRSYRFYKFIHRKFKFK